MKNSVLDILFKAVSLTLCGLLGHITRVWLEQTLQLPCVMYVFMCVVRLSLKQTTPCITELCHFENYLMVTSFFPSVD